MSDNDFESYRNELEAAERRVHSALASGAPPRPMQRWAGAGLSVPPVYQLPDSGLPRLPSPCAVRGFLRFR